MTAQLPREWVDQAVCASTDGDVFFPGGGSVPKARMICAQCPVRMECLEWALSQPDHMPGVWGGLSERERKRIRVARGKGAAA